MRKLALIALGITGLGLALAACAPRYYDDRYGYYDRPYGHAAYGYRDRNDDRYYDRDYRDRY